MAKDSQGLMRQGVAEKINYAIMKLPVTLIRRAAIWHQFSKLKSTPNDLSQCLKWQLMPTSFQKALLTSALRRFFLKRSINEGTCYETKNRSLTSGFSSDHYTPICE
ncbi:MAG: hypothetical protein AB1757_14380 [Acidobacteriota bacterium]